MYYKTPNNTIAYQVTEPSTHVMVSFYKSENTCTITFGYELKNDAAVALLKTKDFAPATKEEFDEKCKSSLKAIVSLCKKQGIQVPGIDQMNEFFNSKNQKGK